MKNLYNIGFIVLILVVLGCNCSKLEEFTKGKSTPPPLPPANATPSPSATSTTTTSTSESPLTKAKFDQIKKGMPKADVERLLGSSGEEVSTSKGGGHTYTVVKWTDKNYAYVIITYDNGKVWTMSQGGLK